MKEFVKNSWIFFLAAGAIYALGVAIPMFTGAVSQGASMNNLNLPDISVTEESWAEMDVQDQWSSATWAVTTLSDGSGFATRSAAGWLSDYQLACLHRPVDHTQWSFVGYDVAPATLVASPTVLGFVAQNGFALACGLMCIIGCAVGLYYVFLKKKKDVEAALALQGIEATRELEMLRREVKDIRSFEANRVKPSKQKDILDGQVESGLISEDEAHSLRKQQSEPDSTAESVIESLRESQNSLKEAQSSKPPVVVPKDFKIGSDLDA